jgi:hypothetical protein
MIQKAALPGKDRPPRGGGKAATETLVRWLCIAGSGAEWTRYVGRDEHGTVYLSAAFVGRSEADVLAD